MRMLPALPAPGVGHPLSILEHPCACGTDSFVNYKSLKGPSMLACACNPSAGAGGEVSGVRGGRARWIPGTCWLASLAEIDEAQVQC